MDVLDSAIYFILRLKNESFNKSELVLFDLVLYILLKHKTEKTLEEVRKCPKKKRKKGSAEPKK